MTATVLMPVYNGASTLPQAIESILAQDDPDFELLVIDDASTDGSGALARTYSQSDPRVVVVIHERNAGLAATLNEGLTRARYDLVLRMDQDDESLPGRLRVQREFMEARPELAVAGSYVLHMGAVPELDRLVKVPSSPRDIAARLQLENCMYHPSVAMRRNVVLEAGGYRPEFRNAEDYDLWLRLSRAFDLANIEEPLIRYRFSVSGMTLSRKWEQLYYVCLAQVANETSASNLPDAEEAARARLEEMNRRQFMSQTARGTVDELVQLRLWKDALDVAGRFAADVGPVRAARLLFHVVSARVLAWSEP